LKLNFRLAGRRLTTREMREKIDAGRWPPMIGLTTSPNGIKHRANWTFMKSPCARARSGRTTRIKIIPSRRSYNVIINRQVENGCFFY